MREHPPTKMGIQNQIHGTAYMPDEELAKLCELVEDANLVVEIGSGYGGSTIAILWCSKAPLVVSIDPFVTDGVSTWRSTREITERNVKKLVGDDFSRWLLYEDYSFNVVPTWKHGLIDVLFIDGDHRYEHVKRDWESWLPLVRADGVIMLHDSRRLPDPEGKWEGRFYQGWQGPTQVAQEAMHDPRVALIAEVKSMTVWRIMCRFISTFILVV